jgi:DNA mismatch repair protein MutS
VFLHAVRDGPANRSYGLAVAQLAGVPRKVVAQARIYLAELETARDAEQHAGARGDTARNAEARAQGELPLFAQPADPRAEALRRRIAELNPDALTPRQALELIYELRLLAGPPQ